MFFNSSARYVHIWALSAGVVLAEGLLLINTKDLYRLPALYYAFQPWTTGTCNESFHAAQKVPSYKFYRGDEMLF